MVRKYLGGIQLQEIEEFLKSPSNQGIQEHCASKEDINKSDDKKKIYQ
jgi:hypothetical protein